MKTLTLPITAGLELRTWTLEDAQVLFDLTEKNRAYLRQWLPWLDDTKTVEDSRAFIEKAIEGFEKNGQAQCAIWQQGKIVGAIGLHEINEASNKTTIGYWLDEAATGHNIMTQAVSALLDYGFNTLHLHRIEIRAAVKNTRSRAIPQRLGFKEEGILAEAERLYDRYEDVVVYGMLASNWKNR